MEVLIQITGLQYACEENSVTDVMAELEDQKPEVVLVTEQTHDFGIIVSALIGTEYRGVVSRFDLMHVLRMMQHDGTSVLVGHVTETDTDGRCYTVCVNGDYPLADTSPDNADDLWADWHWTGAPLLDSSPDDRRLDVSLKVVLAELRRSGRMNRQTLLKHLDIVQELAKWDVSRETQTQLSEVRRLVGRHPDSDVRAIVPRLRHTLTALGSRKRMKEFQDAYLPALTQGKEAEKMYRQWLDLHRTELTDIKLWQPTISSQLDTIEAALMQLPADLCYQKDQFGALMHRLLYLGVPRRKLVMLLSALVLRRQLRRLLGLSEEDATTVLEENERQLLLRLAPIFYGNHADARDFLLIAKGQKPSDITSLVNLWVREKRICPAHCRRPLWTVLHEAGIYTATESNWNVHVGVRKGWG